MSAYAVVVTMPEGAQPAVIGPVRNQEHADYIAGVVNDRAEREEPGIAASVVPFIKAASDFEAAIFER